MTNSNQSSNNQSSNPGSNPGIKMQRALSDTLALLGKLHKDWERIQLEVERLNAKVAMWQEDLRSVLLGQLAYTADSIASNYVYATSAGRPMSLGDLRNLAPVHSNPDVKRRWQQVVTFAEQQGVSIDELVHNSRPLRSLRSCMAHGFSEELDTTTPDLLRELATPVLVESVDKMLLFLKPLTLRDKPLLPRKDVADSFEDL
ncbi:hypothetical protein CHLRE_17g720850v5 [Chlamydomonas reinhardtii]|uniref:Uncharacterized protein n=1 Tax=Chlamydomonas reinhardtii TaxID=3055 RepID=A0A2K3CQ95_CHLRE|nr:uncharacterized protein CHLRE_17g720850v5 [Chlamydomonas reinhardtii]PNW70464.1 hypothetical protein CHLRE_17g720850v5 [Chlamydomonas reinhardtii]